MSNQSLSSSRSNMKRVVFMKSSRGPTLNTKNDGPEEIMETTESHDLNSSKEIIVQTK